MKKIYLSIAALLACSFVSAQTSWFTWDNVSYKGAFPVTDGSTGFNANQNWAAGWTNWDCENTVYPAPTQTISADITSNTTWHTSDVIYLSGFTHVTNGAELTIEPGCHIYGAPYDATSHTCGVLIITKGSKIHAIGTAANPIIFSSAQPAGSRQNGDWGGVMLCGKAPVNKTSVAANPGETDQGYNVMKLEGFYTDDVKRHFGGIDPNDNSGELKYVRIEFAGVSLNPSVANSEINALTMGGVGRGTMIDFVQCSFGGDDSFEWFGGSVDCKHLVAYRAIDDDFDTDMGYSGRIQFGLAIKDPNISDYNLSGGESNGLECDNNDLAGYNANVPSPASPSIDWAKLHTKAVFSNLTVVGHYADGNAYGEDVSAANPAVVAYARGAHLRRNMAESVLNSIFVGFKTGLRFQVAGTKDNLMPFQTSASDSSCTYANNLISASHESNFKSGDVDFTLPWYQTYYSAHNLDTTKTVSQIAFVQPNFNSTTGLDDINGVALTPDFRLQASSTASTGATFTDPNVSGGFTSIKETASLVSSISVIPNPANGVAKVVFAANKEMKANVNIYDVMGNLVATLANNAQFVAGNNQVYFNTMAIANGVYFVSIEANNSKEIQKLIVNN